MTERVLSDLTHRAPIFGERDAMRAALGELTSGWPALVRLEGTTHLLLPAEAVGHSEQRRFVDLPLVRAVQAPADASVERVLAVMGSEEFVVVEESGQPVGVASRLSMVEAVADSLRAAGAPAAMPSILESLPEGVVIVDRDRTITYVNASGQRVLSILAGAKCGDRLEHLGGIDLDALVGDARAGVPRDVRVTEPALRIYSVRTLQGQASPGGEAVLILRDVTHIRHRQKHEATQDRMALLGQLAGGIAHDFNNVLTVIMGQASLLEHSGEDSERAAEAAQSILEASERASKLVRQLLAFGRRELVQPVVLDMSAMLRELESLMRRLVGESITFNLVLGPDLWPVSADPVQIERVLANLVVNARNAMPDGGVLTVEASNVPDCTLLAGVKTPARAVRIVVQDSGVGMDAATLARVFEPYFTSRPENGTGLGLASVHATVTQLGGHVSAESVPGEGTTFEVLLRAAAELAVQAGPRVARGAAWQGHGHILAVEDDPALVDVVRRILEHAGYSVRIASDADAAREMIRSLGEPDLLLTDITLGRGSGLELARELRSQYPQLRALLMSGYAQESLLAEARHPLVDFLPKPFGGEDLLQRVAALVGVADDEPV